MNYVLIFCDSTAGRLIYARSHYNMCAGESYSVLHYPGCCIYYSG